MIYKPENWVILKFTEENEKYYFRIFGSWGGRGHSGSDSWRLSSGADSLPIKSVCEEYWIRKQDSGSCYELLISNEGGGTFYTKGVLQSIINKSDESETLI
jgi:hypothetical protein